MTFIRRHGTASRNDVTEKRGCTVFRDVSLQRVSVTVFGLTVLGCSHKPPEDFAPDPGLVAQIQDIRMITSAPRACPGWVLGTAYEAVLTDGSRIPFSRTYDKDHPPRLHVVFLERTSPDAVSRDNGDWVTSANPLATVMTGFRLSATLRAKPSVTNPIVVPPDYDCMRHAFTFVGEEGSAGQAGENGPDVMVRLAVLRSPFYDRLFVAGIQVGVAAPFYVLGDATTVPPADWLVIESRGGRGGPGVDGGKGAVGTAGGDGCPAQPGGPGGGGGNGAPGGSGGRGGRISIIVPLDDPFLAGIVDARSPGGPGGPGGDGGAGGKGGKGGKGTTDSSNRRCPDAADGAPGQAGRGGSNGTDGAPGPRSVIVTTPMREVFGVRVPPEIGPLLERLQRRP